MTTSVPVPGVPVPLPGPTGTSSLTEKRIQNVEFNLRNLYVLYYIQGGNPHHQTENFFYDGGFKGAIARAHSYCDKTTKRFIKVTPFLTDLDHREKQITGDDSDGNSR